MQYTRMFWVVRVLCPHALAPVPQRGHGGQGEGGVHLGVGGSDGGRGARSVRGGLVPSLPSCERDRQRRHLASDCAIKGNDLVTFESSI